MNNFDLKNFLTENKLTTNSKKLQLEEGYSDIIKLLKGTMEYLMKENPELSRQEAFDIAKEQVDDIIDSDLFTYGEEDQAMLDSIELSDISFNIKPLRESDYSTELGRLISKLTTDMNDLHDRFRYTAGDGYEQFFKDAIDMYTKYYNAYTSLSKLNEAKYETYSDKEHGIEELVVTDDKNPRKLSVVVNGNKTVLEMDDFEVSEKLGSGYASGIGHYLTTDHPDHRFEFNINLAQEGPDYVPVEVEEFIGTEYIGSSERD